MCDCVSETDGKMDGWMMIMMMVSSVCLIAKSEIYVMDAL